MDCFKEFYILPIPIRRALEIIIQDATSPKAIMQDVFAAKTQLIVTKSESYVSRNTVDVS